MKTQGFTLEDTGQFIMTGIKGCSLTNDEARFIKNNKIGGVILFSYNYKDPMQLKNLTKSIQELSDKHQLFIAVDQEGGRVQRFKEGFTRIPSMEFIGSSKSLQFCRDIHEKIAIELKEVGVNLSFSPVCDTLTNKKNQVIGDRAFSSDPEKVAEYACACIDGLSAHGIISVAKHFPGHGDTLEDSHDYLPRVSKPLAEIVKCELIPFKKVVHYQVDMVLMAHILVEALDSKIPTSLSFHAYNFLRNELNYSGVIISDDMLMKAISDHFSWEEAATRTLESGCDVLVYRSMDCAQKAYRALVKFIAGKKIPHKELCQKLTRIVELKNQKLS